MKSKLTPIALAVAAIFAAPVVFAGGSADDSYKSSQSVSKSYEEKTTVSVTNNVSVSLTKDVSVKKTTDIEVLGIIGVDSNAMSTIDDKQINHDNDVENQDNLNEATVGDNAFSAAQGNFGVNVSAGDNNMQDNAAAISATDTAFVFGGSADAEIFSNQDATKNITINSGNTNVARIDGQVGAVGGGNLGMNIAAGNSNLQKNNVAMASAKFSVASEATVAVLQQTGRNWTRNRPNRGLDPNHAIISGAAFAGFRGNAGINVAAGTNNLQANNLAVAVTAGGSPGGTTPLIVQ